jgi:PII-like signaling protein
MRGSEGFGAEHGHRTDRVLTLSEDVPLVSVAVDTPARIDAALRPHRAAVSRARHPRARTRVLTGRIAACELPELEHEATKLTVYVGRQEHTNGRPAYEAGVDLLHRSGVPGATVLRGVDFHRPRRPPARRVLRAQRRRAAHDRLGRRRPAHRRRATAARGRARAARSSRSSASACVPVASTVIDTPERLRRWFAIVAELTGETGLVTSEMVPAFHATGPARERDGLRLAARLVGR